MNKEQFLAMFKECIEDGTIEIEIDTTRDEYYGDYHEPIIKINGIQVKQVFG